MASISNDPTRRYFESMFASVLVQKHAKELDADFIKETIFYNDDNLSRQQFLPSPSYIAECIREIHEYDGSDRARRSGVEIEYADLIKQIKFDVFSHDVETSEKLIALANHSFAGILMLTLCDPAFPIQIYGSGAFSKEARGKELKDDKETHIDSHAKSAGLGLMQSTMPLPADHPLRSSPNLWTFRAADQARFIETAPFVEHLRSLKVHPFSNSNSGTVLAMLRVLARYHQAYTTEVSLSGEDEAPLRKGGGGGSPSPLAAKPPVTLEQLKALFQTFIPFMLKGLGGHSFYEFCTVLEEPAVKAAFADIEGFETLNMYNLFFVENQELLADTLDEAILYNKHILAKAALVQELYVPGIGSKDAEPVPYSAEAMETATSFKPERKVTSVVIAPDRESMAESGSSEEEAAKAEENAQLYEFQDKVKRSSLPLFAQETLLTRFRDNPSTRANIETLFNMTKTIQLRYIRPLHVWIIKQEQTLTHTIGEKRVSRARFFQGSDPSSHELLDFGRITKLASALDILISFLASSDYNTQLTHLNHIQELISNIGKEVRDHPMITKDLPDCLAKLLDYLDEIKPVLEDMPILSAEHSTGMGKGDS